MIDKEKAEHQQKLLDRIENEELRIEVMQLISEAWQDGYDFAYKEIHLNRGASF